jgi:zinc protease
MRRMSVPRARRLLPLVWGIVFLVAAPLAASADEAPTGEVKIQDVVSPGGIEAWLVEEHTVPVVAVEVAFAAGSRLDPKAKPGTASFMAAMLDEGAGDMDDSAFKAALENSAIRMGFSADRDSVNGSFRALAPYADEAFRLFSLALAKPRFDAKAVARVRGQMLVRLKQDEEDPGTIASRAWYREALAGHPYAHPVNGTSASVKKITRADLIAHYKANIGRDRMKIVVVGPISAARLKTLLDKTFGPLPKVGPAPTPPALKVKAAAAPVVIDHDIPQSVVIFGGPGLKATDKGFLPAYVMNYILGGGGFSSRLMDEIREKRGLTYGISTGLASYDAGGLLIGGFSSRNDAFGEAYQVLNEEIERLAKGGVSDQELADAKTYLTGSYALRFDSNNKIADQLLAYRVLGYGIDYVNKRNAMVNAVTKQDVARAAQELLKPGAMRFVVVGRPEMRKADADASAVQAPPAAAVPAAAAKGAPAVGAAGR